MRNLKIAMLIIVMGLFMVDNVAQAKNQVNIPQAVMLSLNKKYPGAIVKKWKVLHNAYTAKAIIDGHKYFATFDNTGNWISTASSISVLGKIPKVINTAYLKTQYSNWNVYYAKKVEKPTGDYYQLMVDDINLHIGQNSRRIYDTDKLLEFKANGALAMIKDITENPVP